MIIQNSETTDIEAIFNLYRIATDYQRIKFPGNLWPTFERQMVETEIAEQRQWKMVIAGEIACIWAITFEDPQIWEARNIDPAIYIHRIATNPRFRGQNFVQEIVKWAKNYALSLDKQFIRMDTCGHNTRLIAHYQHCGFQFLGMNKLANTDELPAHYHEADVCLFEIAL